MDIKTNSKGRGNEAAVKSKTIKSKILSLLPYLFPLIVLIIAVIALLIVNWLKLQLHYAGIRYSSGDNSDGEEPSLRRQGQNPDRLGIEAVQTEPGYIVIKIFEGMEFYRPKFEQFLKYGIRIGVNQLGVNTRRRLGEEWRGVLVEILEKMAREQVGV